MRVAEERYRAARERLKEASSAASRSRESSAMPTPRGGAETAEAGASSHVESGRNQNETETENGSGKKRADAAAEVREMAEKAAAAVGDCTCGAKYDDCDECICKPGGVR